MWATELYTFSVHHAAWFHAPSLVGKKLIVDAKHLVTIGWFTNGATGGATGNSKASNHYGVLEKKAGNLSHKFL